MLAGDSVADLDEGSGPDGDMDMSTNWRWKQNRTMQSLYDGNKQLGVYVPMPNNKAYPWEIRQSIAITAPLIAAAPELLKAAKAFVRWVDGCWGASEILTPETLKEYEEAKAAIAKVEGR